MLHSSDRCVVIKFEPITKTLLVLLIDVWDREYEVVQDANGKKYHLLTYDNGIVTSLIMAQAQLLQAERIVTNSLNDNLRGFKGITNKNLRMFGLKLVRR